MSTLSFLQSTAFFRFHQSCLIGKAHQSSERLGFTWVRTIISLPSVMDSWGEVANSGMVSGHRLKVERRQMLTFPSEIGSRWCLGWLHPPPAIKHPPNVSSRPRLWLHCSVAHWKSSHKKHFRFIHTGVYWIREAFFSILKFFFTLKVWQLEWGVGSKLIESMLLLSIPSWHDRISSL